MKHIFLYLLVLPMGAMAQIPVGYYSSVTNGQKSDAVYSALHSKISSHTVLSYDDLEDYYEAIDFDQNGYLMDIYSTCTLTMADGNKSQNGVCDAWNKEHTIPQSWFSGGGGMKSDLFHVYPTDACVNGARSNYPYGETTATGLGLKSGKDPDNHGLGKLGTNSFDGYSVGKIYEPDDQFKGDIARNYFYMVTCYSYASFTSSDGSKMFTSTGFTVFALKLLLKWHRQDPVSQKEIDRNNGVYKVQKNRNPFIDYPYLVEYIWGDKKGQAFDWAKIISSESPSFIPGQSSGLAGNDSTGGIITPYYVKWLVDSIPYTEGEPTTQVKPGCPLTQLPATPASCDARSEQFIGWSQSSIADSTDVAPTDLFSKLSEAPAISSDATFYAIFAHATQTGGDSQTTKAVDFSSLYSKDTEVQSITVGATLVKFVKAGASTQAKYYTTGNAVRCYSKSRIDVLGKDISKIVFTFGSGDGSNTITASQGDYAAGTWTGKTDSVSFTIGGTSGHRRIAKIEVTAQENTTVTEYSRIISQCTFATSAVNDIEDNSKSKIQNSKFLRNGRLYIIVNDKIYTTDGQVIR